MPPSVQPSASLDAASPRLQLIPLAAIVLLGFLSVGLPLPVLAVQVHDHLGFDAVTVGWVIGLQSLVTVLTRGMSGHFVDRFGPKPGVLAGLPLAAAAGLFYLLSTATGSPSLGLATILAGRVLLGLAESLFLNGAMNWGIARVGAHRTGLVMAWQGIAIYGAIGFGAPVGLAIMNAFGFRTVALATIALPMLGCVVALVLAGVPPAPPRSVPGVSFFGAVRLVWRYGVTQTLATVPFAIISAFLTLYYGSRGWSGAGFALAGFAGGYVAVRLFFADLPDRIGGRSVALVSFLIEIAGQAFLWAAPNEATALVGAVLTGIGYSLVFPALGVEALRLVPAHSRGIAVGAFIAFFDVALGLAGPLAGLLVGPFGYPAVFAAGALATAAAFGLILAKPPRRSGEAG